MQSRYPNYHGRNAIKSLFALLPISLINTPQSKATFREKVFFGLYFHIMLHHWSKGRQALKQVRTLRQEPRQYPWRNASHWFTLLGLFSLLSYACQNYLPRESMAHSWLESIKQLVIKHHNRLTYNSIYSNFFQLRFPFPKWPDLPSIDKKINKNTIITLLWTNTVSYTVVGNI